VVSLSGCLSEWQSSGVDSIQFSGCGNDLLRYEQWNRCNVFNNILKNSEMIVRREDLKALGFRKIEQYFGYIVESRYNGQHTQAKELFYDLEEGM
jgi:hypothetical protein